MKRVLIVSPHFPPVNAPDMQRVRMSLPYYRKFGWDPVVLTVDPGEVEAAKEPELVGTVPPDVRVVTCQPFSRKWTRLLGVGNLGLRAWTRLRSKGSRLLADETFDLVFFSNTQFITFPLGRIWRRKFGVPYVLDVQDPWVTDYYQREGAPRPPGGWKYAFARVTAKALEGWSFVSSSGLMSVSPDYLRNLRARYPELETVPSEVIGFGASDADLRLATQRPAKLDLGSGDGVVNIVYTGAYGPIVPHAVNLLFEALRTFREANPSGAARLRFHFLGTSYVAPGAGRPAVLPLAEKHGVADLVREVPHRLGHLETLRLQRAADALFLGGSSDRAYSPSKAYPYFLSGRPVLALVFRGSVMEQVVEELNFAHLVRISENEPREAGCESIHRFFDTALRGFPESSLPRRNEALFRERYLAETLARRQCALFDQAVGGVLQPAPEESSNAV